MIFDRSQCLDSGMRVDEAIGRARTWWDGWRGAIARGFNTVQDKPIARAPVRLFDEAKAPGFVIQGEKREDLPSGILSGKPWDELTEREQLRVVKTWHDHHRPV